jgi:sulfite reductase alpha subunit-like flavoprotein
VTCFVRRGSFPTPNSSDPLLLIGPGTGVAPMRAFLQERYGRYDAPPTPAPPPPTPAVLPLVPKVAHPGSTASCMMYFGCRSAESDFLYAQEWRQLQDASDCQVHTAFSREGPPDSRRCYVTHLLSESGQDVWNLIRQVSTTSKQVLLF